MPYFSPVAVRAGQVLTLGSIRGAGCRAYLAVRHGFDVPEYLGSRSTFTLGGFGGHAGRALRKGDVLRLLQSGNVDAEPKALDEQLATRADRELANRRAVRPARRAGFLHARRYRDAFSAAISRFITTRRAPACA